jgi:hypothetical protein
MAEQLGLRKIMEDVFHTIWWVPGTAEPEVVSGYMRALARAETALAADLPQFLKLWELTVPAEFQDRPWDYMRFGRGERFVHQPIPQAEFTEIMDQVKRWGLDQYLKEHDIQRLIHAPAA